MALTPLKMRGLILREATDADERNVLRTRNDEMSRRFSYDAEEISEIDHRIFFRRLIGRPAHKEAVIYVAESTDHPYIGYLRSEPVGPWEWNLSFALEPQFRGLGIARFMIMTLIGLRLQFLREQFMYSTSQAFEVYLRDNKPTLTATAESANVASMRVLQSIGFVETARQIFAGREWVVFKHTLDL